MTWDLVKNMTRNWRDSKASEFGTLSIIPVVNLTLSRRRFAEAFQRVLINVMLSPLWHNILMMIHGVTEPHGAGYGLLSSSDLVGAGRKSWPIEGCPCPPRLFLQMSPSDPGPL